MFWYSTDLVNGMQKTDQNDQILWINKANNVINVIIYINIKL